MGIYNFSVICDLDYDPDLFTSDQTSDDHKPLYNLLKLYIFKYNNNSLHNDASIENNVIDDFYLIDKSDNNQILMK